METEAKGEAVGCILLLDPVTGQLRHGAAPGLPDSYNQAIDGLDTRSGIGTCAGAAGCASGSQPCSGGSPALEPAPIRTNARNTAARPPAGGAARQDSKSPPTPNPTAIAASNASAPTLAIVA